MAVLKNKTQGNFTIVSQNIMRDRNLSIAERGMLITLLSLPDNWHLTIKGLCEILPDGKDKIGSTLNSLIEKGYVTREQSRGENGKFDSTDLEVHETPIPKDDDTQNGEKDPEAPSNTEISPYPENPDTANPDTEKPHPENPPQYNINIYNNNKLNTDKVCSEGTLSDSEYDELVSEFGKESVDYQINRIREKGYKGCHNFETIRKWCTERLNRAFHPTDPKPKKNSFFDFPQRDIDFDTLERRLVKN